MSGKYGMVLAALLLVPIAAQAGDLGWLCLGNDCPRSDYCPLHYWTYYLYRIRADVHPSYLDQYAPGPIPTVPPQMEKTRYPCRTIPAAPTTPYADPEGYFGRAIVPEK
jgi:hypothetical protein